MSAYAYTLSAQPNVPGLVRWLQHVYQTDPACALRILRTGWPSLTCNYAHCVLRGDVPLALALEAVAVERD